MVLHRGGFGLFGWSGNSDNGRGGGFDPSGCSSCPNGSPVVHGFGGVPMNWVWLVGGVIAIAVFASSNNRYGKWIFAIVVAGALLLASDTILQKVRTN